jgi:hypothetical protein
MRRGPEYQWRFLLNANSGHLEVHDLDNEHTGPLECQIDEIIRAGNARYLRIENANYSLNQWLLQNPSYDGCAYCLPKFHFK